MKPRVIYTHPDYPIVLIQNDNNDFTIQDGNKVFEHLTDTETCCILGTAIMTAIRNDGALEATDEQINLVLRIGCLPGCPYPRESCTCPKWVQNIKDPNKLDDPA